MNYMYDLMTKQFQGNDVKLTNHEYRCCGCPPHKCHSIFSSPNEGVRHVL